MKTTLGWRRLLFSTSVGVTLVFGPLAPGVGGHAFAAERSNQGSGQSDNGKNDAVAAPSPATGGSGQSNSGAARDIVQSAGPLQLTDDQHRQLNDYFTKQKGTPRADPAKFTLSVGAAVPKQVPLKSLPKQVSSLLNGYQGDQYVLAGNQLVIVDPAARRIVALAPIKG